MDLLVQRVPVDIEGMMHPMVQLEILEILVMTEEEDLLDLLDLLD
jgi:hypothetical protein